MTRASLVALLLAAAPAAFAQGGLSIGAKVGTLGPGIEMAGYLTSNLNVRVSGQYLPLSVDESSGGVNYDAELRFADLLSTLDWYPLNNHFRVSAGFSLSNNKMDLRGNPRDPVDIGDHSYSAAQVGTLRGDATFDSFAPYIGVGYGNALTDDRDLTISLDFGLLFQGDPNVRLRANGTASGDPTFQSDLRKEEGDAQDVAENYSVYPVISIGIAYYFW